MRAICCWVFLSFLGSGLEAQDATADRLAGELITAVKRSDRAAVKTLLEQGADPGKAWSEEDDRRRNVLHHAIDSEDHPIIAMLLDAGADPWIEDHSEFPAVLYATDPDELDTLEFVLKRGIDINRRTSEGCTLLFWVARWKREEAIEFLLEHGADPSIGDEEGTTPLMIAQESHQTDAAQYRGRLRQLVAAGADIDQQDRAGDTALMRALRHHNGESSARVLLEEGADSSIRNKAGYDALMIAMGTYGRKELIPDLLEKQTKFEGATEEGDTALLIALRAGQKEVVGKILETDVDLMHANKGGETALHLAAGLGEISLVRQFLEAGLSASKKTTEGLEPLHYCSWMPEREGPDQGQDSVVTVLLENGADINARDRFGNTPLHYASTGDLGLLRGLLALQADAASENEQGMTALAMAAKKQMVDHVRVLLEAGAEPVGLHHSAEAGNFELMDLLLETGADPEERDETGKVALHHAASYFHRNLLRENDDQYASLVAHVADVTSFIDAQDEDGVTPLMWIAASHQSGALQGFLSRNPKLDVIAVDGRTAAHWAAASGNETALRLLEEAGANLAIQDRNGWGVEEWLSFAKESIAPEIRVPGMRKKQRLPESLADAVALGNIEYVAGQIEREGKVDERAEDGIPLLHLAALHGHEEMLRRLLDEGMDPGAKSGEGVQAIHWAVMNDHLEIVRMLLDAGVSVDAVSKYHKASALQIAFRYGHEEIVRELLKRDADLLAEGGELLIWAMSREWHDLVDQLLEIGIDPLHPLEKGKTPMIEAGRLGALASFRRMAEEVGNPADLSGEPKERWEKTIASVAYEACLAGHGEFLQHLIERYDFDVNHRFGGTPGGVTTILAGGKEIVRAYTPLSVVAEHGDVETVRFLLEAGARIEGRTRSGDSPFVFALVHNKRKLIDLFFEYDPPIEERDRRMMTPLLHVALRGELDVLKQLVEAGSDVNAQSEIFDDGNKWGPSFRVHDGVTAFHLACFRGRTDLAEYLLAQGADLTGKDGKGRSALHVAVLGGKRSMCQWLLGKGMSPNEPRADNGDRPIDAAVREAPLPVIKLLLENGAEKTPELYQLGEESMRERNTLSILKP